MPSKVTIALTLAMVAIAASGSTVAYAQQCVWAQCY
jgi:hypothetical protein